MRAKLWMIGGVWTLFTVACGSRTGILGGAPLPVDPGSLDGGIDGTVALEGGDAEAGPDALDSGDESEVVDAPSEAPADASFDVQVPDALFSPDAGLLCEDGGLPRAYVLGTAGTLYAFDPATGLATTLGTPSCPSGAQAWTLSVSKTGIAYVVFEDWAIYAVDLGTLACKRTSFTPDQLGGLSDYGLAVSRTAGSESLYVYGTPAGAMEPVLASMTSPSFVLTEIAQVALPDVSPFDGYDMQADLLGDLYVFTEDGQLVQLSSTTGAVGFVADTGFLNGQESWAVMTYQNAVYLFADGQFAEVSPTTHLPGASRTVTGLLGGDVVIGASAVPCLGTPAPP